MMRINFLLKLEEVDLFRQRTAKNNPGSFGEK